MPFESEKAMKYRMYVCIPYELYTVCIPYEFSASNAVRNLMLMASELNSIALLLLFAPFWQVELPSFSVPSHKTFFSTAQKTENLL